MALKSASDGTERKRIEWLPENKLCASGVARAHLSVRRLVDVRPYFDCMLEARLARFTDALQYEGNWGLGMSLVGEAESSASRATSGGV